MTRNTAIFHRKFTLCCIWNNNSIIIIIITTARHIQVYVLEIDTTSGYIYWLPQANWFVFALSKQLEIAQWLNSGKDEFIAATYNMRTTYSWYQFFYCWNKILSLRKWRQFFHFHLLCSVNTKIHIQSSFECYFMRL